MITNNITRLAKELILHLRRLAEKQEITDRDLCQYFRKNIRCLLFMNRHHAVIRRRLLKRRNAVILRHNCLKYKSELGSKTKKLKKRNIELALSWSRRVVLHLKQRRALLKLTNRESKEEILLQPDDLKKLNERIEHYKNSTNKAANNIFQDEAGEANTASEPIQIDLTETHNFHLQPNISNFEQKAELKGTNFLDSLIDKLKKNDVTNSFIRKPQQEEQNNVLCKFISKQTNEPAIHDDSDASSDFLGFSEDDPYGLLPTPKVPTQMQSDKSPFISEKLDTFLRENSLENRTRIELPKIKQIEEGMVCEGAQPPKIQMQKVPDELAKARTVAEKRMLLERKRSLKYFIIENENTVYRELKRRSKYNQCNDVLITRLQAAGIPFRRDCWKAASWLRTSNGKFCFQTLNVNGKSYKLIGTRGNHRHKVLGNYNDSPICKKIRSGCPKSCTQPLEMKGIKLCQPNLEVNDIHASCRKEEGSEHKRQIPKLLESLENTIKHKPGPLSRKALRSCKKEIDAGEVEVYKMPTIQIEVFPKVNQPLDERIKPYLKLVLPSEKISREWAEFAVSTLVTRNNKNCEEKEANYKKSFTFDIPYLNNQKTVLVRKVYKRNEKYHNIENDSSDLTFRQNIDPANEVEVTCGKILSEMIDSVALSLSEDSMVKNDPDIDYLRNEIKDDSGRSRVANEQLTEVFPKADTNKSKPKKRLLLELKRLNATIVEAQNDCISAAVVKCNKEFCRLGCVCQSFMGITSPKTHCKQSACMFKCTCKNSTIEQFNCTNRVLSEEDALLIREKATARLAKIEKDFCATVVLTDHKTYLLNESQSEKRRIKRVPKRFIDFVQDDILPTNNRNNIVNCESPQKSNLASNMNFLLTTLKHCNVSLSRLEGLQNIEPWCMIHCLYKCFCEGKSTEGEPFKFAEGDSVEEEEIIYPRKRRYSFDKEEKEPPYVAIKRKYYSAGYVSGSRVSAVPASIYKSLNREKAKSIKLKVMADDNVEKRMLLKQRLAQSRDFKNFESTSVKRNNSKSITKDHEYPKTDIPKTLLSQLTATDLGSAPDKKSIVDKHNLQQESKSKQIDRSCPIIDSDTTMPIITSVMSLNVNNERNPIHYMRNIPIELPSVKCRHGEISLSEFHKSAIGKLNVAVTRTMQSICHIQKQNSKHIPLPAPRTLSSLQWRYFLEAFVEELVFVWEVCVRNRNILIATKMNIMPQIHGATSAANIKVVPREKLPMIGKMLLDRLSGEHTQKLSVLMSGEESCWHIIGFINSQTNYLAAPNNVSLVRPTPESHPQVTMKVNELYKMLFLREIQVMKQKQAIAKNASHPPEPRRLETQVMEPKQTTTKNASDKPKSAGSVSISNLTLKKSQPHSIKVKSNLEIMPISEMAAKSLVIPLPNKQDHLWLMVDLVDDFSHIYVPEWKDFLTYSRIKRSFEIAAKSKKTVKLAKLAGKADIYATPDCYNRLYIGPYFEKANVNLVLCQNVDEKILLREDFEKSQNINRSRRTVGYWLQIKNSTLICQEESKESENITNRTKNIRCELPSASSSKGSQSKPTQISLLKRNYLPRKSSPGVKHHGTLSNQRVSEKYVKNINLKKFISQKGSLPSSPEPVNKISGYFVTDAISLGKIRAERFHNCYLIKLPNIEEQLKLANEKVVNKYLTNLILQVIEGNYLISRTFMLKWRFIRSNSEEERKYDLFSLERADIIKAFQKDKFFSSASDIIPVTVLNGAAEIKSVQTKISSSSNRARDIKSQTVQARPVITKVNPTQLARVTTSTQRLQNLSSEVILIDD